ncbi:S-layer homology domain-containing protein [Paenibacillus thermoaerophilus]|uniref:S-layer homology domain-containing protein n=1 Tax=Paenibacillus thermoaerophilus TaxID=1215385 RepID=A0ABW2V6M2_9BACL|nr:S-layer homology domain-containing protein [Paenibacillus thermoaerophilus]TMV18635.1 S-layer homology domain-containing protein [Paenibacillus thermoaerophilus]
MKRNLLLAKRVTGIVTVTTLLWGQAAFAQVTVQEGTAAAEAAVASKSGVKALQAPRSRFPDVGADHWAVKHVAKLAIQDIVRGDDQGRYNPDSPVSRQDALIMIVRLLGLEDEALANKLEVVMPIEVRPDAKPYVVQALDSKWIDLGRETNIALAEKSKPWGDQPATREWVSRVVIRALGKTAEAEAGSDGAESFADAGSIGSDYIGYVSEAVKLGIVTGFEDGTFRPAATVTRAQMAAFLGRSEKYLAQPNAKVRKGVFAGWKDTLTMRVYDESGSLQEWRIGQEPQFYDEQANSVSISTSDLRPGHPVYALVEDGVAYYVERLSAELQTKKTEGKLVELDLNTLNIKLATADNQQLTIQLDPNVIAVNTDGAGMDIALLPKGTVVSLEQVVGIPGAKPSRLVVLQLPLNKDLNGTVENVNLQDRKLSVRTSSGVETFPLSDTVSIFAKGKPLEAERLGQGDTVVVAVRDSVIESIDVLKQVVEIVETGKLVLGGDKLLTVERADGTYGTYAVADNVKTYYNGVQLRYTDLLEGDQVRLEISENKINKIEIIKRNLTVIRQVTILSYSDKDKVLTVKRADGTPAAYALTDSTVLQYNGQTIPLAQFGTIFANGKRVDLTVNASAVMQVKMSTAYEGTLFRYDSQTREITLQDAADGEYVTFKLADYAYVRIPGKSSGSLSDLQIGDEVRVQLNAAQDRVDSVIVRREIVYRVADLKKPLYAGATPSIVVMEAGSGATSTYLVGSSVKIEQAGRTGLTFDNLKTREPVALRFLGDTLESIVILTPVRGEVTAVDAASGILSVRTSAGEVKQVEIKGTTRIYRSGSVLNSLSQLSPGDRVEATLDPEGNAHMIVFTAESRTVTSYDRNTGVLKLARKTLSDTQTDYVFLPGARIHKGGEEYHPNFLMQNQSVKIYVWRDEILELERT